MPQAVATNKPSVSQPGLLSILRIILGLILIWKGINFIRNTAAVKQMVEQTGIGVFSHSSGAIALLVTIFTLLCGFFILVGLFTGVASIIQLPIIIVALFFINLKNIERNGFELVLTVIVLVLLILFTVKGSGPFSADEYFRRGAAFDKNT
ncbi:MAG: DoxX family membrane protein [Flavisolibacter sp.]|nr:DoxX family membrane protein [Flavisolibacter sp.]